MSYKKFTRGHGRTYRISKYKWSTPDKAKKLRSKFKRISTEVWKRGRSRPEVTWVRCGEHCLVHFEVWPCGKYAIHVFDER